MSETTPRPWHVAGDTIRGPIGEGVMHISWERMSGDWIDLDVAVEAVNAHEAAQALADAVSPVVASEERCWTCGYENCEPGCLFGPMRAALAAFRLARGEAVDG